MSAPTTTRKRQRRPGPSPRDLGLNQRALGISPRQLRGLPEAEIQRRLAAAAEKVAIEWGGDWKSFKDGPHFQLPWAKYPG